jgi:hypothetical protein
MKFKTIFLILALAMFMLTGVTFAKEEEDKYAQAIADLKAEVAELQTLLNSVIEALPAAFQSVQDDIAEVATKADRVLIIEGKLNALIDDLQENLDLANYLDVNTDEDAVRFIGANVYVQSGTGSTDGTVNGLGNLIVGYDENLGDNEKSGSHNLVVGSHHTYASYGGFVAGAGNTITARYASVSGGGQNWAEGFASSVSGGLQNKARDSYSSVSGGSANRAEGPYGSVIGGVGNVAEGYASSVSGGQNNLAYATYSSILGGFDNGTGDELSDNQDIGKYSSVSGGQYNLVSGLYSSISGGSNITISGDNNWAAAGIVATPTLLDIESPFALNITSGVNLNLKGGTILLNSPPGMPAARVSDPVTVSPNSGLGTITLGSHTVFIGN